MMIRRFKSTKPRIYLFKNQQHACDGFHFLNLTSVNSDKNTTEQRAESETDQGFACQCGVQLQRV